MGHGFENAFSKFKPLVCLPKTAYPLIVVVGYYGRVEPKAARKSKRTVAIAVGSCAGDTDRVVLGAGAR